VPKLFLFSAAFVLAPGLTAEAQDAQPQLPHLQKQGSATQLIVAGHPFLILGGELHNSSSSNLDYIRPVWPRITAMNLNTVLGFGASTACQDGLG
jgi:hypothetical protein